MVWQTFNKFGPRHRPYEFDKVQVYSHSQSTWYTVEDMRSRGCHDAAYRIDPPPELEPLPAIEAGSPLVPLAELGQEPIVRGGAFGVTGNAYLVTRAKELLVKIVFLEADDASSEASGEDEADGDGDGGSNGDDGQDKASLLEEAVVLVWESKVWKGWAEVRRDRRDEEGRKMASRTLPPLEVNGGERRWVSVADRTKPILSEHEGQVLREWETNGLWKRH